MRFSTLPVEMRNAILDEVADSILENWRDERVRNVKQAKKVIYETVEDLDLPELKRMYRPSLSIDGELSLTWDEYLK